MFIVGYKLQLHSSHIQIPCSESQRGGEILGKGKQAGGDGSDTDSKGKILYCSFI